MAIGRTSQEVDAVRSVFLQALDGVVVPIKDPEHRSRSAPSLPIPRHHTSTIWRGDDPTWVERPFNEKLPCRTRAYRHTRTEESIWLGTRELAAPTFWFPLADHSAFR